MQIFMDAEPEEPRKLKIVRNYLKNKTIILEVFEDVEDVKDVGNCDHLELEELD